MVGLAQRVRAAAVYMLKCLCAARLAAHDMQTTHDVFAPNMRLDRMHFHSFNCILASLRTKTSNAITSGLVYYRHVDSVYDI